MCLSFCCFIVVLGGYEIISKIKTFPSLLLIFYRHNFDNVLQIRLYILGFKGEQHFVFSYLILQN